MKDTPLDTRGGAECGLAQGKKSKTDEELWERLEELERQEREEEEEAGERLVREEREEEESEAGREGSGEREEESDEDIHKHSRRSDGRTPLRITVKHSAPEGDSADSAVAMVSGDHAGTLRNPHIPTLHRLKVAELRVPRRCRKRNHYLPLLLISSGATQRSQRDQVTRGG